MKIGVDISVLQTPHRMRGIGATLVNYINHLSDQAKLDNQFVFYVNENNKEINPIEQLNLTDVTYEVRPITRYEPRQLQLNRYLRPIKSLYSFITSHRELLINSAAKADFSEVDHYLQFDQNLTLPKGIRSTLIVYDLIPYVMEADYLWSYRTARIRGSSIKGAVRHQLLRNGYIAKIKKIANGANQIVAISEHTKKDFIQYANVPKSKISVIYLGVDDKPIPKITTEPSFHPYAKTNWGYIPKNKKTILSDKPFILYVGGADPRRKLTDLVAAFNNLRAREFDIRLILAGDTATGPNNIPNSDLQQYFKHTSYIDDIIFLGFISEDQKNWLYQNTLAFVYPSRYEGFGLPILEAMRYGAPVVAYDNTSVSEISNGLIHPANDFMSIHKSLIECLMKGKKNHYNANVPYTWSKFSNQLTSILVTKQK